MMWGCGDLMMWGFDDVGMWGWRAYFCITKVMVPPWVMSLCVR